MNKLLFAHFARIKKDKVLLSCMIFMFLVGLIIITSLYDTNMKYDNSTPLDAALFNFTIFIPFPGSVFCSLFLGTEYSDGTIRNKLIVGHRRPTIYLASLIISLTATFLMCLAWFLAMLIAGVPFIGVPQASPQFLLIFLLNSLCMLTAFCSIFTMIGMLCHNKAAASVISLLLVLFLLLAASYINSCLSAPEFSPGYFIDASGAIASDPVPNPNYLRGSVRAVYEFFLDFLPTGQAMQYSSMSVDHENGLWQMPLYDLIITAVTTGSGLWLFRKKDIQ